MRVPFGLMVLTILILILAAFTAMSGERPVKVKEVEIGDNGLPVFDQEKEKLVNELRDGFVKAVSAESQIWWECGVRTPAEEWPMRAEIMARHLMAAIDEFGLNVTPWGVWGVIWSESRGNRCSIGPYPRRYAEKRRIIKKKSYHRWTEDEVKSVFAHKRWGGRAADIGLSQVVWKRYARLPCYEGDEGCFVEKGKLVRYPTLDEMISVDGGCRVAVYNMQYRQRFARKKRHIKTPWMFWPSSKASMSYGRKIAGIVRMMGGPWRKVLGYK